YVICYLGHRALHSYDAYATLFRSSHEPRRWIARSRLRMVRVEFVEPRATRHDREGAQAWGPHRTPTGIPDLGEFGGAVHYSCPSGFHPAIGTSIILTVARMNGLSPVPSTIWCWATRIRLCIWWWTNLLNPPSYVLRLRNSSISRGPRPFMFSESRSMVAIQARPSSGSLMYFRISEATTGERRGLLVASVRRNSMAVSVIPRGKPVSSSPNGRTVVP